MVRGCIGWAGVEQMGALIQIDNMALFVENGRG